MREITIPNEKITRTPLADSGTERSCQYCSARATYELLMPMNSREWWRVYVCDEHNAQFATNGYRLLLTAQHDID